MQTDVREAAQGAVDQSKSFINRQVRTGSAELGERVDGVARDLRSIGAQLRDNPTAAIAAPYLDRGADAVENLGRYLRDGADLDRLLSDAEAMARRQPWAFAAGALVAGFAGARVLKSAGGRGASQADAV